MSSPVMACTLMPKSRTSDAAVSSWVDSGLDAHSVTSAPPSRACRHRYARPQAASPFRSARGSWRAPACRGRPTECAPGQHRPAKGPSRRSARAGCSQALSPPFSRFADGSVRRFAAGHPEGGIRLLQRAARFSAARVPHGTARIALPPPSAQKRAIKQRATCLRENPQPRSKSGKSRPVNA